MKKSITLLLAILICIPTLIFAQDAKSRIAFEKLQHNFGTFKEDLGVQSVEGN